MERRLATILAADAVGYSRNMGEDESKAFAALRASRQIIDPIIEQYQGRIFNHAGDSVVAEFNSSVNAVHDHGNKAGTGAAISDATLSAARLALRTQKGIEDRTIRVTPRNLLVPPAQETTAEKWLACIAPATAADVNPFSGSLSLVVEPRLTSATRWYVTADPGEIDGLEFAYLSGAEGPLVESRSGWDVVGVEIRVILDFGAGFIDHRGWFMNAGA